MKRETGDTGNEFNSSVGGGEDVLTDLMRPMLSLPTQKDQNRTRPIEKY